MLSPRGGLAPALALLCILVLPGAAAAAVTATSDADSINLAGTAGNDSASVRDDGANLRIANAIAGAGCQAAGNDVLCPRGNRTLVANLGEGLDAYDSTSSIAALVIGGPGADRLFGGPANETLRGDADNDRVEGAGGDDIIVPGGGDDNVKGGAGRDTLSFAADGSGVVVDLAAPAGEAAGGEFELLIGSPHNDLLVATAGLQRIDGGAGIDAVSYAGRGTGGFLIDLVAGTGGPPATPETALANLERVTGSPGPDAIIGGPEANLIDAGAGDDVIRGGPGADVMAGGAGSDTVDFGYIASGSAFDPGIVHVLGGVASRNSENDRTVEVENIVGSPRADALVGSAGDNVIAGGDGNDRIAPGAGTDRLAGGAGTDTLDYTNSTVPINLRLGGLNGRRVREFARTPTTDTTTDDFEIGIGTGFADVLSGSSEENSLFGGAGPDVLDGGAGNDTLDGGNGNDRIGRLTRNSVGIRAAQAVVGASRSADGADRVRGGSGNDAIDVRDGRLDVRVDCGTGVDLAREDLDDDDEDLDVAGCETIETSAVDQRLLTRITRVGARRSGARTITISCPRESRVTCKGRASFSRQRTRSGRRTTSYRVRRGRTARVEVRGSGRYLVLSERDQRRRLRRVALRL